MCEEAVVVLPDASDFAADLVQFRAMCMSLGGLVIDPLGDAAWGPGWRGRQADLRQIVHEVTARFVPPGERFPMGDEPG